MNKDLKEKTLGTCRHLAEDKDMKINLLFSVTAFVVTFNDISFMIIYEVFPVHKTKCTPLCKLICDFSCIR